MKIYEFFSSVPQYQILAKDSFAVKKIQNLYLLYLYTPDKIKTHSRNRRKSFAKQLRKVSASITTHFYTINIVKALNPFAQINIKTITRKKN